MRIDLTEGSNPIKVYKVLFRRPNASCDRPIYSTPFMEKNVPLDIVEGRQNFASSKPHLVLPLLEKYVSCGYIHSYSTLQYAVRDYLDYFILNAKCRNCVPVIFECEIPVNDISNHCFIGEFDYCERNGYCSKELRFLREIPEEEIEDCILTLISANHYWSVYRKISKDNKIRKLFSIDRKLMRRYLKPHRTLRGIWAMITGLFNGGTMPPCVSGD